MSAPVRGIRSDRVRDRSRGRLAGWSAARRDTDSRRWVFRTDVRWTIRFVNGEDGPHWSIHSDPQLDRATELSAPDPSRHGNGRTPHLRTAQPERVCLRVCTGIRDCTVRGKRESRCRDEGGQSRVRTNRIAIAAAPSPVTTPTRKRTGVAALYAASDSRDTSGRCRAPAPEEPASDPIRNRTRLCRPDPGRRA